MLSRFRCVQLFATPWTIARQTPLSWERDSPGKNTGMSCHALLQGIFRTQGSIPCLSCLPHWHAGFLPLGPPGKPFQIILVSLPQAIPNPHGRIKQGWTWTADKTPEFFFRAWHQLPTYIYSSQIIFFPSKQHGCAVKTPTFLPTDLKSIGITLKLQNSRSGALSTQVPVCGLDRASHDLSLLWLSFLDALELFIISQC